MRILLVNDYGTMAGGAEVIVLSLRDALRSRGHEVRVLTSDASEQADPLFADATCLGSTSRWRTVLQSANPLAARAVRRMVADFKPDVVHVNLYLTQLSPLILRELRHVPTVYYAQWYRAICPLGTRRLPDGSTCPNRAGLACLRNGCIPARDFVPLTLQARMDAAWGPAFDRVTAISHAVARRLKEFGAPHLREPTVVHPGTPVVAPRTGMADRPTAVSAGRLVADKGNDVLLRAFAKVAAQVPHARLVLLGDGPDRPRLESLARELGITGSVDFRGRRPHAEAIEAVREAWVACVPSLWEEPFGMIAAEAQMQGVAAIVSGAGGLAEIVDDGVTGWTVPPGDVATLADRLGQALGSDRSLVRSLGDAGHAMARERFGLDGFADRFEAVYRSMVSAPTREVSA